MSVTLDILRSYTAPRVTMARRLPGNEGDALTYLITASILLFIGLLPGLARQAHFAPDDANLMSLLYGAFLGAVFLAPLVFYDVAAVIGAVLQAFGTGITYLQVRLTLFWSLLAITPFMLLRGLVEGLIGPGAQSTLVNAIAGLAFLWIWAGALRAVIDTTKAKENAA